MSNEFLLGDNRNPHVIAGLMIGSSTQFRLNIFNNILRDSELAAPLVELIKQEQRNYVKRIEERLEREAMSLTPNPWVNHAIPALQQQPGGSKPYYQVDNPQFTGPFPILSLAPELIFEIIKHLPVESAGALARVNKAFYGFVTSDKDTLNILKNPRNADVRWKLLQLLERDAFPRLGHVACPHCGILHHLLLAGPGDRVMLSRACPANIIGSVTVPSSSHVWTMLRTMPSSLNYLIVRAIALSKARADQNLQGAARQCEVLLNTLSERRVLIGKYIKAIRTSKAHFTTTSNNGDELILQNQVILAPFSGSVPGYNMGVMTIWSFEFFIKFIVMDQRGVSPFKPCDHLSWAGRNLLHTGWNRSSHDFLLRLMNHGLKDEVIGKQLAQETLNEATYAIFYGEGGSGRPYLSTVRCEHCATFCSVHAETLPRIGRVITLHVEKNLGGLGGSEYDYKAAGGQGHLDKPASKWKWESHRTLNPQNRDLDSRRYIPLLAGCQESNINGGNGGPGMTTTPD